MKYNFWFFIRRKSNRYFNIVNWIDFLGFEYIGNRIRFINYMKNLIKIKKYKESKNSVEGINSII